MRRTGRGVYRDSRGRFATRENRALSPRQERANLLARRNGFANDYQYRKALRDMRQTASGRKTLASAGRVRGGALRAVVGLFAGKMDKRGDKKFWGWLAEQIYDADGYPDEVIEDWYDEIYG